MIVVFGSINMDFNMKVSRLPVAGETVLSPFYETSPGGKGANQALAAARSGQKTSIIGRVGDDGMGLRIINNLRRNEVMTSGISKSEYLPTGIAIVARDEKGEKQIIVASGANMEVSASQVPVEILGSQNILLMQMEVPAQENAKVMTAAKEHGARIVLNMAPAEKLPAKALAMVDYLIVNEIEAAQLAQTLNVDIKNNAIMMAQALAAAFGLDCIITLGADGCVAVTKEGQGWKIPAMKLDKIVDTTGAGDCFSGTFTATIHAGLDFPQAIKKASVAAGLACLKKGIYDSYPYSSDIEENLDKIDDPMPVEL